MSGNQSKDVNGGGFRLHLDRDFDTQSAEEIAAPIIGKRRGDFSLDEYRRNLPDKYKTLGDLSRSGGWVSVYLMAIADENPQQVFHWAVIPLGRGGDNGNGQVYLVPSSEHYDVGRVKNQALYRRVFVYVDAASQAQLEADEQSRQAEALRIQLEAAQAQAAQGDIQKQLAVARGKAGQGQVSVELDILSGTSTFTAQSDAESMDPDGPHPGVTVIYPGAWEELAGAKPPSAFGLPKAIIASNRADGKDRHIATQEYSSALKVARSLEPGYDLGGLFGLPLNNAGAYSIGQIYAARAALESIGIDWRTA